MRDSLQSQLKVGARPLVAVPPSEPGSVAPGVAGALTKYRKFTEYRKFSPSSGPIFARIRLTGDGVAAIDG
jgi:hypothetical protein